MNKYFQLNRLIVFFLAIGLLVLGFEIYLEHYHILEDKKAAWIPVIFGFVGGIITLLVGMLFNRFSYYCFQVIMTCSVIVGCMGMYFHNLWRLQALVNYFVNKKPIGFEILTEFTPLLAPSAFCAMGGLGILIAIFNSWGTNDAVR